MFTKSFVFLALGDLNEFVRDSPLVNFFLQQSLFCYITLKYEQKNDGPTRPVIIMMSLKLMQALKLCP